MMLRREMVTGKTVNRREAINLTGTMISITLKTLKQLKTWNILIASPREALESPTEGKKSKTNWKMEEINVNIPANMFSFFPQYTLGPYATFFVTTSIVKIICQVFITLINAFSIPLSHFFSTNRKKKNAFKTINTTTQIL